MPSFISLWILIFDQTYWNIIIFQENSDFSLKLTTEFKKKFQKIYNMKKDNLGKQENKDRDKANYVSMYM